MRYLGIDYGAKRIGIAVSDESGTIAFPRGVIENDTRALEQLERNIKEQKIECIVVGDTKSYSDLRNPVTDEADEFIEALKVRTDLPIERAFEAGSSIEASRYAPESSGHSDAAAAAIILQRFLDMQTKK